MIEAYYRYTTVVNGTDITGILEHSRNIQKGIIFVFSVGSGVAQQSSGQNFVTSGAPAMVELVPGTWVM